MIRSCLGPLLAVLACLGLSGCELFRPFDASGDPGSFGYDPRFPVQRLQVDDFESYAAAQAEPVWCWAACAAMVADFYAEEGRATSRDEAEMERRQAEIVARIQQRSSGRASVEAASRSEVIGALSVADYERLLEVEQRVEAKVIEALLDSLGSDDESEAEVEPESESEPAPTPPPMGFDAERLYRDLGGAGGGAHPVVAALRGENGRGHCVVVTGASCQVVPRLAIPGRAAPEGVDIRFLAIRLWDPTKDPANSGERYGGEYWLPASEFAAHCEFVASRSSAEEYVRFLEAHAEWAERSLVEAEEGP